MSLFGIVFVLSSMDLIKVQYPMAITFTSLVNVFLCIIAWILDADYEHSFKRNKPMSGYTKNRIEEFHNKKFWNLVGVITGTFVFLMIGLGAQFL